MTEPSEAAMKVWREAKRAHDGCAFADCDAPDEAAALVIDRAMGVGEPVAAPDTAYLFHLPECEHSRAPVKLCDCPAPDTAALVGALEEVTGELEHTHSVLRHRLGVNNHVRNVAISKSLALLAQHKGAK